MKIGIFDSGIGGLNVLHELMKIYPNNHYIYYGDTKNVPYGNKSKEDLLRLSRDIIHFFEKQHVEIIIIACGTISSNCYYDLIKVTTIKIYDIITPTINYLNNSLYKNIGLIATSKTVESKIFERRIVRRKVIAKDTPSFVPIIESNQINAKKNEITSELDIFKDKVDCLILGCTHYPLLKSVISKHLAIPLIDMGKILAKTLDLKKETKPQIELYFSMLNDDIVDNINQIIPSGLAVLKEI